MSQLRARERGLCIRCYQPHGEKGAMCAECRKKDAYRRRQRYIVKHSHEIRKYRCSVCGSYDHRKDTCDAEA